MSDDPAQRLYQQRNMKEGSLRDVELCSAWSLGSLVIGFFAASIPFIGWLFLLLSALSAITLGIIGLVRIRRYPDRYKGRGFAITGIVLGSLGLPFFIFFGYWMMHPELW